jgi:hypothetical protein
MDTFYSRYLTPGSPVLPHQVRTRRSLADERYPDGGKPHHQFDLGSDPDLLFRQRPYEGDGR